MIIFLYGEDSYRCLQKLHEIIDNYRKVHQSVINLKYLDLKEDTYENFETALRNYPMFGEKKLFILQDVNFNKPFQEKFVKNSKKFSASKDITIFFEGIISEKDKFFRFLKKSGKFQEFRLLEGEKLNQWIQKEFGKYKIKIETEALHQLANYVGNDLWRLSGEIKKLTAYKIKIKTPVVKREDVDVFVRPKVEIDIFQTIDAIASKNKKQALKLIHQHLEKGDSSLYLFSMITFQFRNLLIVKSQAQMSNVVQTFRANNANSELKMHPYVAQKALHFSRRFSLEELKKIYKKIFQVDSAIKTGKIDPVTALDVFIAEI